MQTWLFTLCFQRSSFLLSAHRFVSVDSLQMAAKFVDQVTRNHGGFEDSVPTETAEDTPAVSDLKETDAPKQSPLRNADVFGESDGTAPASAAGDQAGVTGPGLGGSDLQTSLDAQIAQDVQKLEQASDEKKEDGTGPSANEKTSLDDNGEKNTAVLCCKCGLEREISRCTRKSKKYICFSCNSAASLLSRAISGGLAGGQNAAEEFKSLPEDEQQQFWRDAAGASRQQLATQYSSKLKASKEKEETEGTMGFFRPLSYWAARGFDVKAIEEKTRPEDRREHPVLGLTFRLHLDYSDDKTSKKLKEEREAAGSADHGLAQEPKATSVVAKSDRKTAKQQEKEEAKILAANGKVMSAATKVIAALSSTITKERPYMSVRGDAPAEEDAIELNRLWVELCKIYNDASQLVETYQKNPKRKLPEESLPPLSLAKSTNKQFLAQLKVVRGNKRKNAE